jgi:hypothetical protein
MATQDPNIRKDLQRLSEFLDELENIQGELKKSTMLNKVSNKYERNLEKLIRATEGIINNTATVTEQENYEKLIKNTDLSLKVMQKQNKSDENFQQEFTEVFGEVKANEQQSQALLKRLGTSITGLVASANVISAEARKDVTDTGLAFATGPFGKIMQDTFAGAGEKFGSFMDKFRGGGQVEGQADNGMSRVPRAGTYLLDQNERVLSPDQNSDLTTFLDAVGQPNTDAADQLNDIRRNTAPLSKTIPVFNMDHDARYFDSLINNDDRIAIAREQAEAKRGSMMKEKLEILTEVVSGLKLSWLSGRILAMGIWFRRFKRMPFLMSIATISGALSGLTKGLMGLFGVSGVFGKLSKFLFGTEAKTNEERLIQANEDIERAVRGEAQLDRRGIFKKMWQDNVLGGLGKLGKNLLFGVDKNPRDAKGRFRSKDKMEVFAEKMLVIPSLLARIVGINDEMLEEMESKSKSGGLLGMLKGVGKWILGALGLSALGNTIATGIKGLFASMATAMPALLARALPVAGALFAGFKFGEILNERLGEWFDLDMDLGTYIGRAVYNLVQSITGGLGELATNIREKGLISGIASFFSGPDTETIPLALPAVGPAPAREQQTPDLATRFQGSVAVPVEETIRATNIPQRATQLAGQAAGAARSAGNTVVSTVNNTIQQAKPSIDEWKAYISQQ